MRLPTNLLLYAASAGLAAGSGWLVYEAHQSGPSKGNAELVDEAREALDRGRELTPDDLRDDYSEAAKPWWQNFTAANFVGKRARKPKPTAGRTPPAPPPPPRVIPIEEIVAAVCILFDPAEAGSRCIVSYQPTANVQPPDHIRKELGRGANPAATGPQPNATRPGNKGGRHPRRSNARGGRGRGPTMPTPARSPGILHHMKVGDTLWPPHQDIYLARVDANATALYFSRGAAGTRTKTGEPAAEEKLWKDELNLGQDVLEKLARGMVSPLRPGRNVVQKRAPDRPTGAWVDVDETKAVDPGQWHISRKDNEYLGKHAQRIFLEDIVLRSYSTSSGGIRGVQVWQVSPQLARFGVRTGEVITELNGQPVHSRAQVLTVGRAEYRNGVRVFHAKVLTPYGRVEERTYYMPNN